MTKFDTVRRLYTETIPDYFRKDGEIHMPSPQVRDSRGTESLNKRFGTQ